MALLALIETGREFLSGQAGAVFFIWMFALVALSVAFKGEQRERGNWWTRKP